MTARRSFVLVMLVFLSLWFLPTDWPQFWLALRESLVLAQWYAREHVLLCLVPAFFIAGAVGLFISQNAVMKYLGPSASKILAYSVASISGTVLAVCSCTVLPLFASIYKRGAGLGPATAFLYSGPAINVLAIILTARVLGFEMGVARAIGSIVFAVVIGMCMHLIFRKQEQLRTDTGSIVLPDATVTRKLWQDVWYFSAMIGVLVFANWGKPGLEDAFIWHYFFGRKWWITGGFLLMLGVAVISWFEKSELRSWVEASWDFARQILPLLLMGVLVAGFLLGGPDGSDRGIVPNAWIAQAVGGNSLLANLLASLVGTLMYFATLTEVPILEGLLKSGMGKGPALALLLSGPALSLPSLLVIRSVLGTRKTLVFSGLVVVFSTIVGKIYGVLF